jgi:hypothetical protein
VQGRKRDNHLPFIYTKEKKLKIEPRDEYDTLEEHQRVGKGKHVIDYPMKHLNRATKNLGIKTKTLPK